MILLWLYCYTYSLICFFFLMKRRPPRATRTATLCPYTTLFRSAGHHPDVPRYAWVPWRDPRAWTRFTMTAARVALDASGLFSLSHRSGLGRARLLRAARRSEEHTSELQSLMRISYAVFCLKKKNNSITTKKIYMINTSTLH